MGERVKMGTHNQNTTFAQLQERLKQVEKEKNLLQQKVEHLETIKTNLFETSDLFKHIFSNAPIGILIYDEKGIVLSCNDRHLEILGAPKEKVIGFNMLEALTDPKMMSAIKDSLVGIKSVYTGNYKTATGKKDIYINATFFPYHDAEGKRTGGMAIVEDITSQKNEQYEFSRLSRIFQTEANGIISLDKEGFIFDCSSGALDFFGYTLDEIKKSHVTTLFPPEQTSIIDSFIKEVKKGKSIRFYETLTLKKNRRISYTSISLVSLLDDDSIKEIVLVIHDISEKKQTENKLLERQKIFKRIYDNLPDAVYRATFDGILIDLNKTGARLFGYDDPEELIGKHLTKEVYFQPSKRELLKNQLMQNDKVMNYELLLKKKDGSQIEVELNARLIRDEINNPLYIEGVIRDITDRKASERYIRESEERYALIFNNAPLGFLQYDDQGIIRQCNDVFVGIIGSSKDILIGLNMLTQLRNKKIEECVRKSLSGQNAQYEDIYKSVTSEKETFVRGLFGPITSSVKKILGGVGIIEDVSDRKMIEQDLRNAKQAAEEASRMKSSLLRNMSHELRTPLNGIIGYAAIMEGDCKDPKQKDYLEKIVSSGNRLMKTLNDILELSRIESEIHSKTLSKINLTISTPLIVKKYKQQAEDKNLLFQYIIKDDQVTVKVIPHLFSQIIENIIDNAIKYTKEGSIIVTVGTQSTEGKKICYVSVKDTGIGISKENIEWIFHEFRQGSEGFNRSYEGTGLGLTLAKKMVELMGGSISVKSEPKKGSTFTISFPFADDPEEPELNNTFEEPEYNIMADAPEHDKKINLLLVEDNEMNQEVTKQYLEDYFEVDIASDGEKALQMAEKKEYEAILMDINLGMGMDGIAVMHEIRKIKHYSNCPIITITGYVSASDKEKLLQEGFDDHISKPFNRILLFGILEKHIHALTPKMGNTPSKEQLNTLIHYSKMGDYKSIGEIIEQLLQAEEDYTPFIKKITMLNAEYKFKRIISFIESLNTEE